jgi:uncharacterized protein
VFTIDGAMAPDNDAAALADAPVIDLDVHIVDADDAWRHYLPDDDLLPRVTVDDQGVSRLAVAGRLYPRPSGPGRGSALGLGAGGPADARETLGSHLDAARAERAVLQPGFVGGAALALADTEPRRALLRAHNDRVIDEASDDPRLEPAIALDPLDSAWSVGELARCRRRVEVRAAVTRPTSYDVRPFRDAGTNELLRTLAAEGIALFLHGGTGYYQRSPLADTADTYALTHLFSHPVEHMMALADLVLGGALVRGLRVVHLEADAGWLPWFVERLARHTGDDRLCADGAGLRDRALFTISGGSAELATLSAAGLTDLLAFGSDRPHWDALDVEVTRATVAAQLDPPVARAVLADNARRVLGW